MQTPAPPPVSTTHPGLAPTLSGNATEYLDGSGAYSVPPGTGGSGTVTSVNVSGGTTGLTTSGGPVTGSGTITLAGTLAVTSGGTSLGTLTAHALYVGNGVLAPSAISVGATNTVLHGNTGADPSFSAVVESDLSLSDVTTGNVSITKHGFAPKAPNDATKYLDGSGAYSVPAGSTGALVLLESHAASSSAELDFTTWYSVTYDDYIVEFVDIVPATNAQNLQFQVSTDGGSTWQASSYQYGILRSQTSGATNIISSTSATFVNLLNSMGTTAGWSGHLKIQLFAPASANKKVFVVLGGGYLDSGSNWNAVTGGALWNSGTAYNAFRVFMASGNITSGTVRVYGIAK